MFLSYYAHTIYVLSENQKKDVTHVKMRSSMELDIKETTLSQVFQSKCSVELQKIKYGNVSIATIVSGKRKSSDIRNEILGVLKLEKGTPWSLIEDTPMRKVIWNREKFNAIDEIKRRGFTGFPTTIRRDGKSYHIIQSEVYYAMEFIHSNPAKCHIDLEEALVTLSKFHKCSKMEKLKCPLVCDVFDAGIILEPTTQLKNKFPETFQDGTWDIYVTYVNYFCSDQFKNMYHCLPMQVIHGDFMTSNMVKDANGDIFITDVDKMKYDVRLWDFTSLLGSEHRFEYIYHSKKLTLNTFIEMHYGELTDLEWDNIHILVMFNRISTLALALNMLSDILIITQDEDESHGSVAEIRKWWEMIVNTRADIDSMHGITIKFKE